MMTAMTADEAWERLAGFVRTRRTQLELSQTELAGKAGVSEPTIRVIETARRTSYQPATLRAVSQALDWTPDSIERILADGDPVITVESAASSNERPEFLERLEKVERMLEELLAERNGER